MVMNIINYDVDDFVKAIMNLIITLIMHYYYYSLSYEIHQGRHLLHPLLLNSCFLMRLAVVTVTPPFYRLTPFCCRPNNTWLPTIV